MPLNGNNLFVYFLISGYWAETNTIQLSHKRVFDLFIINFLYTDREITTSCKINYLGIWAFILIYNKLFRNQVNLVSAV